MSLKIPTRIPTEITIQRCQNGPHFRSLSSKSTKRNVFSKVRGQKLDGVISENRFAQKLDWSRKSKCVYHPKRTNMFSSENLRFEKLDDRLETILGARGCKPRALSGVSPRGQSNILELRTLITLSQWVWRGHHHQRYLNIVIEILSWGGSFMRMEHEWSPPEC